MHLQHPKALCLQGALVQVQTQSTASWQIDGDPVGETTEMEVVCNARSLRVLMPEANQIPRGEIVA